MSDTAIDVTCPCPVCGEWIRARVERTTRTVEIVDLGLCTWGMSPDHPTSYELAAVRNERAMVAAAALGRAQDMAAAYHAASHAIAALVRRAAFRSVSVEHGLDLGDTITALADPSISAASRTRRARRVIEVCLAGAEGERLFASDVAVHECASCVIDAGAWRLARCADPVSFCASRRDRMARRLQKHARQLHALAAALLERGTLSAADVRALSRERPANGH